MLGYPQLLRGYFFGLENNEFKRHFLSFLRVIFAFRSHKFSWCCSTPACEALLIDLNSERDYLINFPGCLEAFARRCIHLANVQTHWFFSHKISYWWSKWPEWRRHSSHITFLIYAENAVCARSRSAKQSQCQPRKIVRESLPLLHLNHHNAASFNSENREKYPEKRHFRIFSHLLTNALRRPC
jgi:hypothetical protein